MCMEYKLANTEILIVRRRQTKPVGKSEAKKYRRYIPFRYGTIMTFRKIAITIIAAFENRDFTIIVHRDERYDDLMFLRKFCVIKLLTLNQTFIFRISI